jgi:DNA-binding CsgD family transcriptional regulator
MKPLTPTEKAILDLVGQGMSTNEIASVIDKTEHAVESYRRNLLNKFDAKNSAEMMKKAIYANALSAETVNPNPSAQ